MVSIAHAFEHLGHESLVQFVAPLGIFFAVIAFAGWVAATISEEAKDDSTQVWAWGTFAVFVALMFLVNWPSAVGLGRTACDQLRGSDPEEYVAKNCGAIYPQPVFTTTPGDTLTLPSSEP